MSAVVTVSSQMPLDTLAFMKKRLANQLMDIASAAVGGSVGVIYRPAIANDFNAAAGTSINGRLTVAVATLTAVTRNTNVFSRSLPANTAIGIYGIAVMTAIPMIDLVTFAIGAAKTIAQIQLTEIYANQEAVGYWDPIIFYPNQTLQIGALTHDGLSMIEEFDLLAYVAEPAGLNIYPNDIQ